MYFGARADNELLVNAAKQVDRRKYKLELWVRKYFDPAYGALSSLGLAVNAASDWSAYPQGKEHTREELEAMCRLLPSEMITDAIGFLEAQTALLSSIERYRDASQDLHEMNEFGVQNITQFPGYEAWRRSDASFVDNLRELSFQPNLGRMRAFITPDWGRYDREHQWPAIPAI